MRDDDLENRQETEYFMIKLIPPRPTFANDMKKEEADIMKEHAVYWEDKTDKGFAIIFGPVLDPKGVYGLGIVDF